MTDNQNDGWVLVPREPTEAMKVAAMGPIRYGGRHGPITSDQIRAMNMVSNYKAMISAAPVSPTPPDARDGRIAELEAALAVYDASCEPCPLKRPGYSPLHCPKCGATAKQNCGPSVSAGDRFIKTARSLLTKDKPHDR